MEDEMSSDGKVLETNHHSDPGRSQDPPHAQSSARTISKDQDISGFWAGLRPGQTP